MATVPQPATEYPVPPTTLTFDEFYQREYRAVLGLASVLCRNRATAEEVTQEAFTAAYRRWEDVSLMASPEGWVRRVVANRAVSRFRRLGAESRAVLRLGRRDQRRAADPDLSDDVIAVRDAIGRLSTRQAEVIVLVYFAGLSHGDSARVLGCGVETVRTHLERAKRRLAVELASDEVWSEP